MKVKTVIVAAILLFCSSHTYAQTDSPKDQFKKTLSKVDSLQAILEKDLDVVDWLRTTDRIVNEIVKTDA